MFHALEVEYRPIESLKPCARNPRKHSPKQIKQIAESIRQFGFINPILTDHADRVIAGHGRLEAARLLGMDTVPTIQLNNLSEAQNALSRSLTTSCQRTLVGIESYWPWNFATCLFSKSTSQ